MSLKVFTWLKLGMLWAISIIPSGFVTFKDWLKIENSAEEISEILVFNELSVLCAGAHRNPKFKCLNNYCSKRHISRILNLIHQAHYSIDIAIYTITLFEMLDALKRALTRGVTVRVITDREMVLSSGSKILRLSNLGIEIRMPDTTAMMHHKFLIIDSDNFWNHKSGECAKIMYGSANWTRQGFNGNWENCVISSDKILIYKFKNEFNRMWKSFKYFPYNINKKS